MRPPCRHRCCEECERTAVLGYGDANAEFHIIGDRPAVHGGKQTGIPFFGNRYGDKIISVLEETGFVADRDSAKLDLANCFLSYVYCCCTPSDSRPSDAEYAQLGRFYDAELRAIAADVLIPVGETPTRIVVEEYTAQSHRLSFDMNSLHGSEIRGRGFLVLPLRDPRSWSGDAYESAVKAIQSVKSRDYSQMVDLGRFLPDGNPYYVR